MAVTTYYDEMRRRQVPLTEALHDEQVDLVNWLGEKGYEVQFE